MREQNFFNDTLQSLFFLTLLCFNSVCNVVCMIIYPIVFRKWFGMKKQSNQKDKSKAEFSLIVIGLCLFIANTLFTLYFALTIYAMSTGIDIRTFAFPRDGCALFESISQNSFVCATVTPCLRCFTTRAQICKAALTPG